jgi:phosphate acetyltransferase
MHSNTPFIETLINRAKAAPGRVILPEGDDPRVIAACQLLLSWNAVRSIKLITTTNSAPSLRNDTRVTVISNNDPSLISSARINYEKYLTSRNKSMDPDALKKLAESPLIQAGNLLYEDHADCVVAGCVATTADVIRAAISTVGLAPGIRTVSGSFLMDRSDVNVEETFVFADCGVVIDPSTEQLVDIAKSSADTLQKLTHKAPVVAFLSFSTKQSADHPAADKVRSAARLFQQKYPTIESDGELQFDSAIIPAVGAKKAPGSRVPGRANCFIFPNLDAGNIAYKITQRLAGFGAYGPILQGLSKPYSDLSRGASPEDIAISAIINILRSR